MSSASNTPAPATATDTTRRESMLYLPGTLTRAILGALTLPILSIWFVPADVGRYDLTNRFVDFLYMICAYWLGTVIVRFYSTYEQRNELGAYLQVVNWVQAGGIAAGLIFMAVARTFVSEDYRGLLDIAIVMFVGYTLFQTGLMMLRAKSKSLAYSASLITASVGRLALGLLLVVAVSAGIGGMIWGSAIAYLALYLVVMLPHFGRMRLRFTPAERNFLRETLAYGLPLGLGAVMVFLLGNADRYLLQHLRSDAEVGLFAVGSQFGEQPIFVLFSTLMLAAFPGTARVFDRDGRGTAEAFVAALTRTYLLLAVPVVALLMAQAQPFLGMFPREYPNAYPVMPWVALGTFLQGLSQYPALGLLVTKRTRMVLVINALGVCANLAVNSVLIPRMGFAGCGVTRVVANGLVVVLMAAATYRCLTWRVPWGTLVRVGLAGAAIGLGARAVFQVLPAKLPVPVTLGVLTTVSCSGLLAFAILLVLFREIRLADLLNKVQSVLRGRT